MKCQKIKILFDKHKEMYEVGFSCERIGGEKLPDVIIEINAEVVPYPNVEIKFQNGKSITFGNARFKAYCADATVEVK